jgi:Uma2 family endonuclease
MLKFGEIKSAMPSTAFEENLLEIPDLPFLLERLHARLDDEKVQREKFRNWITAEQKAEFINGQVVMHSPAAEDHNEATGNLHSLMNFYCNFNGLGKVRIEKALVGMSRNDYEPDIAFWRAEVAKHFQPEMNVYPIPDLIVEVLSPGKENIKRDTETKFADYAAHGVREYWIVDPRKKTVAQYLLSTQQSREYELYKKVAIQDNIESIHLIGFSISVKAIFDAEENAQTIQGFLQSPKI